VYVYVCMGVYVECWLLGMCVWVCGHVGVCVCLWVSRYVSRCVGV